MQSQYTLKNVISNTWPCCTTCGFYSVIKANVTRYKRLCTWSCPNPFEFTKEMMNMPGKPALMMVLWQHNTNQDGNGSSELGRCYGSVEKREQMTNMS